MWVVCDCSCGHPARFPFPRFLAYFQILLLSLEPALSGSFDSLISWFHAIVQVVRVHVCLGADPRIQRLNCVRTTTFCTSAGLDLSLSLCTVLLTWLLQLWVPVGPPSVPYSPVLVSFSLLPFFSCLTSFNKESISLSLLSIFFSGKT